MNKLEQYYNERIMVDSAPNFRELTEDEKSVIANTLGFGLFLGDPNYKFTYDIPKLIDTLNKETIQEMEREK